MTFEVEVYESLESTNDLVRSMAEAGAPEGKVVIAGSQTKGRGRKVGRSFYSPANTGLYMSILLRPQGGAENYLRITTAAAVAVCRAIAAETGKLPLIKWVNDIIMEGKKVCGILTEASFRADGEGLDYAVLGIGVNLCPPKEGFPSDIKDIAGAVSDGSDSTIWERLSASILSEFEKVYQSVGYMDDYRSLSCVTGRTVRIYRDPPSGGITDATPCEEAFAYGIDDDCRLLVRFPDGREEALFSGEISVR